MSNIPATDAQLSRILAYAKERWSWDDPAMLEELYERSYRPDDTPEAFVDGWAQHFDLTDPRELGL